MERGILKNNGKVLRRSHVEEILIENGRAAGVRIRGGQTLKANTAVVSNCDLYNTFKLVPFGKHRGFDDERENFLSNITLCKSFVHLHLGIDSAGIPDDMPPQWTVCNDWNQVRFYELIIF